MADNNMMMPLLLVGGLVGIVWMTKSASADDDDTGCTADSDCLTTQTCVNSACVDKTDPLESFTSYTNQSIYPSFGLSDLLKPDARKSIKGASACAQACIDDDDCVAFTHHREDANAESLDTCYYWSSNQNDDETFAKVTDALGTGAEENEDGTLIVDTYIKDGKNVLTQAAESWLGLKTNNMFINTIQSHNSF